MTLLICPVKPGDDNEELRYALRSLEENLLLPGGLQLLVVGDCPSWLQPDHFLKGNLHKSMDRVVMDNVYLGSEYAVDTLHVDGDVVYINDDMFCLDPVLEVPKVRRNISLRQQVAKNPPVAWWGKSLASTLRLAQKWGYSDPHSYEVHRPLLADPKKMMESLTKAVLDSPADGSAPQWRTVYGMRLHYQTQKKFIPVRDVKISGQQQPRLGSPWLSTDDSSWRYIGPAIRKRFPNPSRWEK